MTLKDGHADAPREEIARRTSQPRGMVGLSVDAPDPAELEAARLEAEADAADVERRRAARTIRGASNASGEGGGGSRADALHARSASLRAYPFEVMPVVTDAMLQMLRIRPEDPALALSDYSGTIGGWRLRRRRSAPPAAMERAPLEEEKKQEKERRLEISRRKAAEARAAIKPKSVVRLRCRRQTPTAPAEEAARFFGRAER